MTRTEHDIAKLIREYSQNPYDGIGLTVLDHEVRRVGAEWRAPVHPTEEPEKRCPYYEYLADIEGDIEDNEKEFVFLVPADPLAANDV